MTSRSQPARPIVPHAVAITIAVAVCILGLVYVLFFAPVGGKPESYMCGRGVGTGFVLWGILAALLLRRSGLRVNALALIMLCGLLGLGSLAAARRENLRVLATVNAIQDDFERFVKKVDGVDGTDVSADATPPLPAPSNDPLNEIQRFSAFAFDSIKQMRRDYVAAQAEIGWNEILSAERLERDSGFAESKAMIAKAREMVDRFEERSKQVVAEIRASIDTLNLTEARRESLRAGCDRGRRRAAERDAEIWQLERQAVSEIGGLIALIETSSGWRAEDGQIAFDDDGELAAFNRRMARIEQIAARQKWLDEQAVAEANDTLESAKSAVR